jgi:hypothetical protein
MTRLRHPRFISTVMEIVGAGTGKKEDRQEPRRQKSRRKRHAGKSMEENSRTVMVTLNLIHLMFEIKLVILDSSIPQIKRVGSQTMHFDEIYTSTVSARPSEQ